MGHNPHSRPLSANRPETPLLNPSLRQVEKQYDAPSEVFATSHWHLSHLKRKDLMQADVAPLASLLLGLAVPVNSVGVLPYDYLESSNYRLEALMMNALQLLRHVEFKSQVLETQRRLFFRAFPQLEQAQLLMQEVLSAVIEGRPNLRDNHRFEQKAFQVIDLCLDALEYYQTYDWRFLMSVISLGYVSWILLLLRGYGYEQHERVVSNSDAATRQKTMLFGFFGVLLFTTGLVLYLQHAPWSYYGYCFFPWLFLALLSLDNGHNSISGPGSSATTTKALVLSLLGVQGIVLGYQHRQVFSLIFILLAGFLRNNNASSGESANHWTLSCVFLSVFPLLPSEYGENLALVLLGGLAQILLVFSRQTMSPLSKVVGVQSMLILTSMFLLFYTMQHLNAKIKPPTVLFGLNWFISCASIGLIFIFPWCTPKVKWTGAQIWSIICLGMTPAYLLLSISYEVLFWLGLCECLSIWIALETTSSSVRSSLSRDCRVAYCYLLFIKIGFFGTGNIASMSSFEISSTYRFVTVFSPFLMGALLVLKIILPMILATVAFQLITSSGSSGFRLFFMILAMCDVLSLQFFFFVKSEGSWKEIGNSISAFGIVNAQIVFIPLLYGIASVLVSSYRLGRRAKLN